jgi:hypothetical protein
LPPDAEETLDACVLKAADSFAKLFPGEEFLLHPSQGGKENDGEAGIDPLDAAMLELGL